jgi:hypothetical protein
MGVQNANRKKKEHYNKSFQQRTVKGKVFPVLN